jgi:HD-GYP domain-containing protein (c-di-GMP phosphodiesterase class II)
VQLAEHTEVAHRVGGIGAACALARERAGGQFDPALVDLLVADALAIFEGLDEFDRWRAVIDAEPSLAVVVSGDRLDDALAAVGTAVDVKSPYWLGHSQAVAELAAAAGDYVGLAAEDVVMLRRVRSWLVSAGSASPTRSSTSAGRSATASGSGCGCIRT